MGKVFVVKVRPCELVCCKLVSKSITNNSISVSPLIFALAESVFMAAETVTPPAPATSAIFSSASWTAVASAA